MANFKKITWEDFRESEENRSKVHNSRILFLTQDINGEEITEAVTDLICSLDLDEEICIYEEPTGKGGGGLIPPEVAEWLEIALKFVIREGAGAVIAILVAEKYSPFLKKLFKTKVEQEKEWNFSKKIVVNLSTVNNQVITYFFSSSFDAEELYEAFVAIKEHFFNLNTIGTKSKLTDFVYDKSCKKWVGF